MLCHAISPSYGYVKASHDVVRHPKLNSDAKILIAYVQGLPEKWSGRPLGEHAKRLGLKGRAYQKAKGQLKENGFVHEWRRQDGGGLWVTDQLLSTVPLTDREARRVHGERAESPQAGPSEHYPTVGRPSARSVGGHLPEGEEREKNSSHPPTEDPALASEAEVEPESDQAVEPELTDPHVREAERVLLSLRHADRQLRLGAREARRLAVTAAEWLRRGVDAAGLRLALTRGLPEGGVRFPFGFLGKRLDTMMPSPLRVEEPAASVREAVRGFIVCEARQEGPEHVFRPRSDEETVCGPCGQEAAWEAHTLKWEPLPPGDHYERPEPLPWRERVAALQAADASAAE
ncbi:hypothetical protein E6R60_25270 [Streptomyces sp. A0642]|uniref:hypothetical protein n=1 Tax=Streptomyces sp. A0642 TaxID=2563100 RepID=UPI0010A280C1|nr:hypothetical protein [Streptomyces sp. A0642]THA73261.1 hypothetical protein E6R60_25270 [Streptomyces sp. A0642]